MDAAVIVSALAATIGTLAGAVALLYRAQVQILNERIVSLQGDNKFWRDLYLSNAEKTEKALDTLGAAIAMLQSQAQERGRRHE